MDASNPSHARTVWFTGLSGSGKTTLAQAIEHKLRDARCPTVLLDGDALRQTISKDLGFSTRERTEHLRRVRGLASLLNSQGFWVGVACITPFEQDRRLNRQELAHYTEVYVKCSIEECIQRDPKGLYARALNGELKTFTGISHPYEVPQTHDVLLDTSVHNVDDCVTHLWRHLMPHLPAH